MDFDRPEARLVVEVDGGQHHGPEEMAKDRVRDKYLRDQGLKSLVFGQGSAGGKRERPGKNLREIAVKEKSSPALLLEAPRASR